MSLTDYLAKNYLTADSTSDKKSKKRKRRDKDGNTGLQIADDDLTGWAKTGAHASDDERPTQHSGTSSEFRRAKSSNWKTVGAPAPTNAEQDAADAIIASAATEQRARAADDEDAPQVVGSNGEDAIMENGMKAGLQSAADVTKAMRRKMAAERAAMEAGGDVALGKGSETIYRDATGRIVNVAMARAEARQKQEAEERKKREEAEALKGDVQREQTEERRQKLKDAKYMDVARYADDEELNEELKDRERWNDPAAGFLTKKKEAKSITGRKLYQGAAEPNRYGIRPGHHWDGVDRANGFERQWFAARNRRQNIKELEYAWQMDE